MSERLHKVLATRGVASRRRAEELIAAGRVAVNGVAAGLGQSVSERDVISVDGRILVPSEPRNVYLALNKPAGVVTSARSTHGERTVMELVPAAERLFPVGRLDKETSGLLLFTNDGDWANRITHPRYEVEKEYDVVIRGSPSEDDLERMRRGIRLPDGSVTSPARVERGRVGGSDSRLSVTVIEGKKRQIRLMAAAIGHPIVWLRRVRVGSIELGDLSEARWRFLLPKEIESIRVWTGQIAPGSTSARTADSDRRSGRSR